MIVDLSHIVWRGASYIKVAPQGYLAHLSNIIKAIKGGTYHPETGWRIPYDKQSLSLLEAALANYHLRYHKEKQELTTRQEGFQQKISLTEEEERAVLKTVEQLHLQR